MSKEIEAVKQTIEQMERMCRILSTLGRDMLPKSRVDFALMAEGPLDQLQRMAHEIDEFVQASYPAEVEQVGEISAV